MSPKAGTCAHCFDTSGASLRVGGQLGFFAGSTPAGKPCAGLHRITRHWACVPAARSTLHQPSAQGMPAIGGWQSLAAELASISSRGAWLSAPPQGTGPCGDPADASHRPPHMTCCQQSLNRLGCRVLNSMSQAPKAIVLVQARSVRGAGGPSPRRPRSPPWRSMCALT